MSATFVLIAGHLLRAAEQKTHKDGRIVVSATVKVGSGKDAEYWNLQAFGVGARAELLRLGAGEFVACQGVPRVNSQRINGDVVMQFSLAADVVVGLKPKGGLSDE